MVVGCRSDSHPVSGRRGRNYIDIVDINIDNNDSYIDNDPGTNTNNIDNDNGHNISGSDIDTSDRNIVVINNYNDSSETNNSGIVIVTTNMWLHVTPGYSTY